MSDQRVQPNGESIAARIVNALGEQLVSSRFHETGATSTVFHVTTDRAEYALRVASPGHGRTARYLSDFSIRSSLWASGLPVAKPVATHQSMPQVDAADPWSLDSFCAGGHFARGLIPQPVSHQLGGLLVALHAVPVEGYGLLADAGPRLRGSCSDATRGMHSRFASSWPFTNTSLETHPTVRADPALLDELSPWECRLAEFPEGGRAVIVHSDLHEGQLLANQGSLAALLDFCDAMAGRCEWDFGSYLYFHGAQCLADLLAAYTDHAARRAALTEAALTAAVLIALHHGQRGEILGKPHRIEASVAFLRQQLGGSRVQPGGIEPRLSARALRGSPVRDPQSRS